MQLSDDRKKRVINPYFSQHNTYVEIAEIERISLREISPTIRKKKPDNKILISTSFEALIQTLRTDPQMANLILKHIHCK